MAPAYYLDSLNGVTRMNFAWNKVLGRYNVSGTRGAILGRSNDTGRIPLLGRLGQFTYH
jgi:hypothetical protein